VTLHGDVARGGGGKASRLALLTCLAAAAAYAAPPEDAVGFGPGMDPPRLVKNAEPEYPRSARAEHVSGTVVVRILIDTDGAVRSVQVESSPDRRLSASASEALVKRLYTPAMRDGRPLAVWWRTEVAFHLPPTEAELDASCAAAMAGDIRPINLGPGDVAPVPISRVPLQSPWPYDPKNKPHGDVTLRCILDACGRLTDCSASKSSGDAYTKAALDTAAQWRYSPALHEGLPTSCNYSIRFTWR